ncbi:uncharacterized protein AFUA_5G11480 [Aspergillus fumigatus Af293]|uniref:Uncharacterized protein n=2 Tax=Aspergillus fumigatus TaxID=746128 RepID=Q4WVB3_ASPFU|nr:conserved hypothetical protein [Aspergillus fumigatus Af293]EAL91463.1 conserved hypothetical protein [Aspergillus fumigatus Af293]EDP51886.1 conserved hypothetical protein [Aspergillus fumigatus A1163]
MLASLTLMKQTDVLLWSPKSTEKSSVLPTKLSERLKREGYAPFENHLT